MKIYPITEKLYYIPLKKMLIELNHDYNGEVDNIISKELLSQFEDYEDQLLKAPNKSFKYTDSHPYSIGILPTSKCNLRCTYCYSETGSIIEQSMTYGQVDSVINMLVKNAIIHKFAGTKDVKCNLSFCGGGEPTFNEELFRYAVLSFKEKCIKNHVEYSTLLVTNGVMSKSMRDFVLENVDQVNISFDCNEEVQNRQRPTANNLGSFSLVDETIKAFMEANKNIYIRSTVLPSEFNNLKEISENMFTTYPNVEVFHLEPLYLSGRGKTLDEPLENNFMIFMDSYIEAYEHINKKFPGKSLFNSNLLYQLQDFGCGSATGINAWVHMDGNILPCIEYLHDPAYSIGRVYDDGIKFNDNYNTLEGTQSECIKCFAFYQCAGGCPRTIVKNKDGQCIDAYSKGYCNMIKEFWKRSFNKLINNEEICGMSSVKIDKDKIDNKEIKNIFIIQHN